MDEAVGICARADKTSRAKQTRQCALSTEISTPPPCMNCFGVDNLRDLRMLSSNPDPSKISFTLFRAATSRYSPVASRRGEAQAPWKSERLRSRMTELRAEFSYVLVTDTCSGNTFDALSSARSPTESF